MKYRKEIIQLINSYLFVEVHILLTYLRTEEYVQYKDDLFNKFTTQLK